MGFVIKTVGGLVLGYATTEARARKRIRELVVVEQVDTATPEATYEMGVLLDSHRHESPDGARMNVLPGRIPKHLIAEWDRRGWLDGEPGRGATRRFSVCGARIQMLSIRLDHPEIAPLWAQQ